MQCFSSDVLSSLLQRPHIVALFQLFRFSRYFRMRCALMPISLRPTRHTERTSILLPLPEGATRITTSSLTPYQNAVSVASILPSPAFPPTLPHPTPFPPSTPTPNA